MFLRMFGIGVSNAIAGEQTEGTVIDVKPCWWLKVAARKRVFFICGEIPRTRKTKKLLRKYCKKSIM